MKQNKMRYDEMKQLYPWIEELFELVAGQIHAGSSPDMSMGYLERNDRRIQERIHKEHREAVTEKLFLFAQLVQENNGHLYDSDAALDAEPEPVAHHLCPYCGSLETSGGTYGWCHNQVAG